MNNTSTPNPFHDINVSPTKPAMCIFLVQDSDRPLYVLARNYNDAINKWMKQVFEENKEHYESIEEMEDPEGVTLVARSGEILF